MENSKIKTITIYSDSSLIYKFLSQACKDFLLKAVPCSRLTSTAKNIWPSISIIDVKNQILFDKIIKPNLYLHTLYPLILLISNDLITSEPLSNSTAILTKPIKYQILTKTIDTYKINSTYQLSSDTFFNTKIPSLIKISSKKSEEIKLTQLECEILKYFLKIQNSDKKNYTTEKEILTHVFKYSDLSNTNTFKVHMHRLKQKLGSGIIQRKENGEYALATFR